MAALTQLVRPVFAHQAASANTRQPYAVYACSVVVPGLQSQSALRRRTCTAATTDQSSPIFQEQEEGYDVYVYETEPLKEGEEKHIISVFVADEAGIINRVAGVFARRGANIESLAVGLNIDKALFTIVVTGTAATVQNLVKQLAKLVKVKYVEDVTAAPRVERELVLIKLRAPPGPARTEVMQLMEIFRARVVDVSERCMTIMVTGDSGKTTALERVMGKFGIVEIARTGKISLKRGDQLLEMGGWGDGFKKQSQQHATAEVPGVNGATPAPRGADVYIVDSDDSKGVWEEKNVLDAAYDSTSGEPVSGFEAHTLSIEVEDRPGVLNQVTGVFARRGYNVQSLAVGNSEREGMSRIMMVVPGNGSGITNLIRQLHKLVYVHKVTDLTDKPFASRELMLIKVRCGADQRRQLSDLAHIFHGNVCDVSLNTVTLEITGKESKMSALQALLGEYGILEVARTGRVAIARDSGVNTRFLQRTKTSRSVQV